MLGSTLFCFLVLCGILASTFGLKVGTGIADMTGPAVEINFMGYAVPGQRGTGILQRLRARAFAFEDDKGNRMVYVSTDGGMGSDLVNMRVLDRLDEVLGKGVYTIDNIAIGGTHTHAAPGGFHQYVLFQATSLGFVEETFDAWVTGVSNAIIKAHKNLEASTVLVNTGNLVGSNINRSPTSYLLNPQEERDQYPEGDTDKRMLLLATFAKETGKPTGMLNWFAVHGTSLNNTNTLVSGDNKGYAGYLMERYVNGAHVETGKGEFVGAFATTNLGDVSPNTMGAKCIDTGLPCDGETSSCDGKCEKCIAFGPGTNGDMYESHTIIGQKQFDFAKALMKDATEELMDGPVDFRHSFITMPGMEVTLSDGNVTKLCDAAMGYSFASGTTDGPGMFNFTQGTTTGNPFWDKVAGLISVPTEEQKACQAPKPILLNTGGVDFPYEWDPAVLPIQILRVGNLFILSCPSEFTTMAGRRLRNAVEKILRDGNVVPADVPLYITISGLTNSYSSYVTTFEEFQAQRYEAASTIYGPHTLSGYIQEFSRLASDLVAGRPSISTGEVPDYTDMLFELMPQPKFDRTRFGTNFGDVVEGMDAKASYTTGEVVKVTFHAANPRNNQRLEGSFQTVEEKVQLYKNKYMFKTVANDGDYSTKFEWRAGPDDPLDLGLSHLSRATLSWTITDDVPSGTYRICYHGDHKRGKAAKIVPFTGCSSEFTVSTNKLRKNRAERG